MATSYSNPHGSGNRRDLIYITQNSALVSGDPGWLLDGSRIDTHTFLGSQAVSGFYIEFDFFIAIVIDEATWYQIGSNAQGTWKWQGSNNNSSWTDIGGSQALGGATSTVFTTLNGNTTAYRYYRILGVSGSSINSNYQCEVEFKCDAPYPAAGIDYTLPLSYGNRTGTITVTAAGGLIGSGVVTNIVNGVPSVASGSDACTFNTVAVSSSYWLKFDFGSAVTLLEARWFQAYTDEGVWKWQGSNDNSTWADIGSSFTLGASPFQIQTSLNGNTTAYRYYRLLGVSGTTQWLNWIEEIVFGLAGAAPRTLSPSAIATAESWGTPKVTGPIGIATIPSAESWPSPVVMYPREIFPAAIPTGVHWFSPAVAGPVNIATIPSGENWPTPFMNVEQILAPTVIPSGELWYPPSLRVGSQRLFPSTIPTGESWPSPAIRGGHQWIRIATIPSKEHWPRPSVTGGGKVLTLLISGKDRTSYMRAAENVCNVDSQTMGRWSLSLDLYDGAQTFIPIEGQTIQLIDIGRRLFAGCIQSVETDRFMGSVSDVIYHVTATDKSSIMDHRVVTKDYLMADWIDYADVARDIATNFLNGEGFDTSGIPATLGPLTQDYAQNLAKVSDLYSQIARDTGTVWWTDDAIITFSPMVDLPAAPFALTETSRNWANLKVTRTTQDFYNKIYVRSNLQIIPSGTGPTGGGAAALEETITFTAWKLNVQMQAGLPTGVLTSLGIGSVVSMTVNGHAQTVVDFNQDYTGQARANLNDYLWFFGEGNNLLSFTYGPPTDALIVVVYIPGSPKLGTTIAQYGTALNPLDPMGAPLGTCGSGLYEGVVQVNDISDQAELDAIAVQVLARLGTIPSVVSYETEHPGIKPGQIQSINVPNSNITSAQVLITRVRGTYAPPDNSRVDYQNNPTGSSFHWSIEGTTNLDPGSNSANYYARLIERTGHPLPLPRYEDVTFAIDPGGSVSSGLSKANPYPVKQTGLGFEIVWSWSAAPADQDLVITITRNGSQIMQVVCSHSVGANVNTTIAIPQFNQLYLYRGDILNVDASYSVTGPSPTPASSVTFVVRWSY